MAPSTNTMQADMSISRGPSPKTIPNIGDMTTNAYQPSLAPVRTTTSLSAVNEDPSAAESQNAIAHNRNSSISSTTSQAQPTQKRQRTGLQGEEGYDTESSRSNKRLAVDSDTRSTVRTQTDAFVPLTLVTEAQSIDHDTSSQKATGTTNERTASNAAEHNNRRVSELTRKSSDVSEASLSTNGDAETSAPTEPNQEYHGYGTTAAYSPDVVDKICLCQPEPKIPRPRNAFILYRQRHQSSILANQPGLANPDISKVAGELWRKEPDHVKAQWKKLAEEEKARHQIQYPGYRFKPKTKRDRGSEDNTSPGLGRCNRCGGKSISTPTPGSALPQTPFPGVRTPATAIEGVKRLHIASQQHTPSALDSAGRQINAPNMAMHANGVHSARQQQFHGYQMGGAPNTPFMKAPASAALSRSPGPATAGLPLTDRRGSVAGYMHYEQDPRSPQQMHTSPMRMPHSAHLTVVTDHPQANVAAYSQRPTPMMGPPPPPRPRSSVHIHPGTPITARTPGIMPPNAQPMHAYGHGRSGSEVYRQLPLPSPSLTPGPGGMQMAHVRTSSMSIPAGVPMSARTRTQSIAAAAPRPLEFISKLKLLRRVAVPLSLKDVQALPSPPGSASARPRGAVVALEGDDWASVEAAKDGIIDALNRIGDFDIHIWNGPTLPSGKASFLDVHVVIQQWLAKRPEIESFIIDGKIRAAESAILQSPELGDEAKDNQMMDVDAKPYIADSSDDDLPLRNHRRTALASAAEQRRRSSTDATEASKQNAKRPIYAQRNRPAPADGEQSAQRGRSHSISHSQTHLAVHNQRGSISDRIRRLSASPSADRQAKRQKMISSSNDPANTTLPSAAKDTAKATPAGKIPLLLIPHYILSASNAWASAIPITDNYQPADHWQWIATLWRGVIGADFTVYIQHATEAQEPPETAVEIKEELGLIAVKPAVEGQVDHKAVRRVAFEIGEWVRGLGGSPEKSA